MAYRYKQITKLSEAYPNEQICACYLNPIKHRTGVATDEYIINDKNGRLIEMKNKPLPKVESGEMKAVKELWEAFGEVPIDNNDKILERFCKFPQGTNRFEVWTWFEEEFNVSVAMDLMGLEGSEV